MNEELIFLNRLAELIFQPHHQFQKQFKNLSNWLLELNQHLQLTAGKISSIKWAAGKLNNKFNSHNNNGNHHNNNNTKSGIKF